MLKRGVPSPKSQIYLLILLESIPMVAKSTLVLAHISKMLGAKFAFSSMIITFFCPVVIMPVMVSRLVTVTR